MRVTKDAQRHLRAGHPWIYDESITSVSHDGEPGDLAVIFDNNRDFMAIGLWDPHSPIRIKVLHCGKPTQIDTSFWQQRIAAALAIRSDLPSTGTTGYRVINGENDGLPGLILDRYDTTLVLKLYSASWLAHLADLVPPMVEQLQPTRVVVRFSRLAQAFAADMGLVEGQALLGSVPDGPVLFTERNLTFEADVINGQKTGHFLDQRDNRSRVGGAADGQRVLDVFACTGGFSVHAAAGGAELVHSVDLSQPALDTARANMAHNQHMAPVAACQHRTTAGDAFDVMAHLAHEQQSYDIVVVDPPSFAKRATEISRALHSYKRLTTLAMPLLRPGGLLVQASCSSRVSEADFVQAVTHAMAAQGRNPRHVDVAGHAVDHPVTFTEGRYLKAIFASF